MKGPIRTLEMISGHFREAVVMIAMQLVLLLTIAGIRGHSSSRCPVRSPITTSLDYRAPPSRLWYYEHVYDHKPARLRVLTDADNAAPLLSRIAPREREITIITSTTRDRLASVEATAMAWDGPLSLAVHVLKDSDISSLYTQLRRMHARVEAHARCRLDIQVVQEDAIRNETGHLYPVNGMRNAAWRMATTELIAILDADFLPSPRMHEALTDGDLYKYLLEKATRERHAFVLPAFEFLQSSARQTRAGLDAHFDSSSRSLAAYHKKWQTPHALVKGFGFPETREQLKQGWENGTVDCFHCSFSPAGHEPTNFRRFLDPGTVTPYSIKYRGYGKNKMAHAYECAHGHGMEFQTLPKVFIFEIPHPHSSSRKFWGGQVDNDFRVAGLYRRFESEIQQRKLQKK